MESTHSLGHFSWSFLDGRESNSTKLWVTPLQNGNLTTSFTDTCLPPTRRSGLRNGRSYGTTPLTTPLILRWASQACLQFDISAAITYKPSMKTPITGGRKCKWPRVVSGRVNPRKNQTGDQAESWRGFSVGCLFGCHNLVIVRV